MVFNSPCLTDKKELIHHEVEMVINSPWIMPLLGTKGLASPEQTAIVQQGYFLEGVLMKNKDAASSRDIQLICAAFSSIQVKTKAYWMLLQSSYFNPQVSTSRYVVHTGRVVVPTSRYVVSAGKVIIIVSPGRLSLVPTSRVLSPDQGRNILTKVGTFNEYVAFLDLIKQDEVVSQEWDRFRNKFDKVVKWFYNHYLEKSLPGPIPPIINGMKIHLFDLYKLVEGLGGYLSVYFGQEFDTIGEILGLVLQQEYKAILKKSTRKVEEDKDRDCLMSHQWDFGETCAPTANIAVQKGKEKLEHFGVKLEDIEDGEDNQPQPISSHYTRSQNLQGKIIEPSTSRKSDIGDSGSNTSDDFTIIT
ncbi:ARID DNA-binding domain-containing protein [Tanacetum coccineum]|uniref:ARID DNA-binding domain-containing protein n=1 Tax=Tanacetum coccineum TaxID=301880 RepID=A0ABQ5FKH5_9ASTR